MNGNTKNDTSDTLDRSQNEHIAKLQTSIRIVHPSLEITREYMLLGFVERRVVGEKVDAIKFRILVCDSGIAVFEQDANIVANGKRLLIEARYDFPPGLEAQWSRDDLNAFLLDATALDGATLYKRLINAIEKHVDVSERGAYVILATWPVLAFIFPLFPAVPFLLLLGPKETGKSQTFQVLEQLCRCGLRTRGTAAALGDLIQSQRVIPLIDQANEIEGEMLHTMTDSYKRGAKRTVTDMEHRGTPHEFETYGPKAFAAHGDFNFDLADRCIQIVMAPAKRQIKEILADDKTLDHVRWQLYRFALANASRISALPSFAQREELQEHLQLNNRAWELWWPLEVVFDWLDVPIEDRQAGREFYRLSLKSTKAELDPNRAAVLRVLASLANGNAHASMTVRSDAACRLINGEADEPMSAKQLGAILRDLGLVRDAQRLTIGKDKKVTKWLLNLDRLRDLLERWHIQ